jgi:predicted Zn-dependent protease
MNQQESAQAEFKFELANNPYSCDAHWMLGDSILTANGSDDEALTELNRAVELCPRLMQARVDRARVFIHIGKSDESVPDLLMAESESPNEPTIHFYLANAYKALGKTQESQQEMRIFGQLEREGREGVGQSVKESEAIKDAAR